MPLSLALPTYQAKRALKPIEARIALPFDRFDRLTDRLRARLAGKSADFCIALRMTRPRGVWNPARAERIGLSRMMV